MFITNENTSKVSKATVASVASVSMLSDKMPVNETSEFILADTDETTDGTIIIADDTDNGIVITDESGDAEDIVISGNDILSDNEIEITDLETGSEATACW